MESPEHRAILTQLNPYPTEGEVTAREAGGWLPMSRAHTNGTPPYCWPKSRGDEPGSPGCEIESPVAGLGERHPRATLAEGGESSALRKVSLGRSENSSRADPRGPPRYRSGPRSVGEASRRHRSRSPLEGARNQKDSGQGSAGLASSTSRRASLEARTITSKLRSG
jgi:hypothetical protein